VQFGGIQIYRLSAANRAYLQVKYSATPCIGFGPEYEADAARRYFDCTLIQK